MDLQELKDRTEAVQNAIPTVSDLRVRTAYEDLLYTLATVERLEQNVSGQDGFELLRQGEEQAAQRLLMSYRQIATLLKAAYLFSNIFVNILLAEVTGDLKISLQKLINKPRRPLHSLSVDRILPAYCAILYRHKIIAHHDVRRMTGSFKFEQGSQQCRLVPFPEAFHISKGAAARLRQMKSRYTPTINTLRNENNEYELLRILFYGIPLGSLGRINPDRIAINSLAEEGGCTSYTYQELLGAIDGFVDAVIDAVT